MVAEHHDQRLVGGVIEVGEAAGLGQPHGDPVGLEEGDDVQGLPAGEGRIECTHIFYDEDPGTSSFAAEKVCGCGCVVARRLDNPLRLVLPELHLDQPTAARSTPLSRRGLATATAQGFL